MFRMFPSVPRSRATGYTATPAPIGQHLFLILVVLSAFTNGLIARTGFAAPTLSVIDEQWPLDARVAFRVASDEALASLTWSAVLDGWSETGDAEFKVTLYSPQEASPGNHIYTCTIGAYDFVATEANTFVYSADASGLAELQDLEGCWISIQRVGATVPEWQLAQILAPEVFPGAAFMSSDLGVNAWMAIPEEHGRRGAQPVRLNASPKAVTEVGPDRRVVAYPNPATAVLQLHISTPKATSVTLRLYDIAGRVVGDRSPQLISDGTTSLTWAPRNRLPAGVYFLESRFLDGSMHRSRIVTMGEMK